LSLKQAVIRPCIVPTHVGVRPRGAVIRRGIGVITTSIIGSTRTLSELQLVSGRKITSKRLTAIVITIEPGRSRGILRTVLSGFP